MRNAGGGYGLCIFGRSGWSGWTGGGGGGKIVLLRMVGESIFCRYMDLNILHD